MTQITHRPITAASDWAAVFRRRARDLGLSHREVDRLAKIPDGYFSKICAGMKIPGGEMIVRVSAALGLELQPVEKIDASAFDALRCGDASRECADDAVNAGVNR